MDREFQDVEDALKSMRPSGPDVAAMERLLAAVEGRQEVLEAGLKTVEARLAGLRPVRLEERLELRCLQIVEKVSHPAVEKVVLFPAQSVEVRKVAARKGWWRPLMGVAAAGMVAALVAERYMPMSGGASLAQDSAVTVPLDGTPMASLNDGVFRTGVDQATDDGVIWVDKGQAYRVVTVVFRDRVREVLADGSVRVTEVPRVERILVKEKID